MRKLDRIRIRMTHADPSPDWYLAIVFDDNADECDTHSPRMASRKFLLQPVKDLKDVGRKLLFRGRQEMVDRHR